MMAMILFDLEEVRVVGNHNCLTPMQDLDDKNNSMRYTNDSLYYF